MKMVLILIALCITGFSVAVVLCLAVLSSQISREEESENFPRPDDPENSQ